MTKILIRTPADLDNALPLLFKYAPPTGSILIIDSEVQPVAVLTPDLLGHYRDAPALASQLGVFGGRRVILYSIDADPRDLRSSEEAAALVGAELLLTRTLSAEVAETLFSSLPSREDYVKDHQRELDEAYDLAQRVADGTAERPTGD